MNRRREFRPRPVRALALMALILIIALVLAAACSDADDSPPSPESAAVESARAPIPAFENIAPKALGPAYLVSNYRPGVAIFDFDRDGDNDFYITQEAGKPNRLFRNDGDLAFTDVAQEAGVAAIGQGSSGAAACDVNNDGFQDLYVGGRGVEGDGLDFRSIDDPANDPETAAALRDAYADRLFINLGDGAFADASATALGDATNLRAASTIACADVDRDGWLDIFVGNLIDEDFFFIGETNHPGHFNVLLRNGGDGTFADVTESAGVAGPQIWMRDQSGAPIAFTDADDAVYEGYDPSFTDKAGNRVGDPAGSTHGAAFFDYDDDALPDLWVANDGDFIELYRNRSTPGRVLFESVAREMGFARVGNWMGFAIGDYDADGALDVFATNTGYHLRLKPPQPHPGPDCKYHEQFDWGSCLNMLLTETAPGVFADVAPVTDVVPSALMPPASLDPDNIHPAWDAPTGLSAYDFGYGAAFFDMDNDGFQDLYWLGSELAAGSGPGGSVYQSAGRMMRNLEGRGFEDVTVEARLLDILGVRYDELHRLAPGQDPAAFKVSARYHENGKSLARGDLNGDGFADLIGANSSGLDFIGDGQQFEKALGPVFVWINQPNDNSRLTLRLRGRMAIDGSGSNADGIGARVRLRAAGSDVVQVREVKAGSSYLSTHAVELEFGLGAASAVAEVEIRWPSGRVQTLTDLPANQTLVVEEPAG